MAFFITVALTVRRYELLKGYTYPVVIFAAASLAMYYPHYFIEVGGFRLSNLIVPLLQIIMFGMGTRLSWKDFARVAQMPKGVLVGLVSQFTIMPFVAWALTQLFSFPPEIAAGIILVGSCPSGLASNVMSYLAKANLALSVTLTALATLCAPLVTPFFMQWLGSQYTEIHFWEMLWSMVQIVLLPVGGGLVFNYFLRGRFSILNEVMPLVSMGGIALIILVITAAGRDGLMNVGLLLIVATFLQNVIGFILGYWGSRLVGMNERDSRTIALEVGMQNSGLASGLALKMGKLATVGLAPVIFGPLMNITGSSLALWWRSRKLEEEGEPTRAQ